MTEAVRKSLRESKAARWIALFLISATMFFAYFFVDVVAPLQKMMETDYRWTPEVFGMLGGSEYFLNVFFLFLILSGIILDKMGIRFTLITAGLAMVIGAGLKFYALSEGFQTTALANSLNSFWVIVPASAKLAFIGFAIFGVGVEMAGITVSKTIVKWFKGKEMALAMGLEMAVARLGVFAVFRLSPIFAENGGPSNSVFMGLAFLCIGFITFFVYTFMDRAIDKQEKLLNNEPAEEFKVKDIGKIFSNPGFLAIAGLCVLFYSAIFPFQKFATDMLASKLDLPVKEAAAYFSYFPIGAMILTPFIGYFLDVRGKGATMMIFGAILLVVSHLIFALVPAEIFNVYIAVATIVILGTAFSLVPASMWPSLPKIVEDRYLGSAYGAIFWIQNIGLMLVPALIGWVITASNPGVAEQIAQGVEGAKYNYTVAELVFASFGAAAIILGFVLKRVDKRRGYGLELPNKKKKEA
jgi:MFS family permease